MGIKNDFAQNILRSLKQPTMLAFVFSFSKKVFIVEEAVSNILKDF